MDIKAYLYAALAVVILSCVTALISYIVMLNSAISELDKKVALITAEKATCEASIARQNNSILLMENAAIKRNQTYEVEKEKLEKNYQEGLAEQKKKLQKDNSCETQLGLIKSAQREFLNEKNYQ